MDVDAARRVLGVAAGTGGDDLRRAYRDALRRAHPDLHGGSDHGTRAIVDAYRVLAGAPVLEPPAPHAPPTPPAPTSSTSTAPVVDDARVVVDGDTVAAELPAGDLFAMLQEVGHRIGHVSYADPPAGLLEIVVELAGYGSASVLLTLQGRATGTTEASCTVEPLGGGPAPPASAVAELLAAGLRTVA